MERQGINLNITGRDEHVPEIERFIHTVKERARAIINTLPFEILPHRLIVEIVYNVMFWLNCFPHKDGIHATLSPCTIITGSNISHNEHCRLQFGSYMQVHEQHNNSMAMRTSGAIALHPTGNAQGSYYFLSLHFGKRVIRNNWTVLPMPTKVIATIHQLAKECKKYKGIVFTDKQGNIINDTLTSDGDEEDDIEMGDITGVYGNNENDNNNTNDANDDEEGTGVHSTGVHSTGVHENDKNTGVHKSTGVHESTDKNDNTTLDNDDITPTTPIPMTISMAKTQTKWAIQTQ